MSTELFNSEFETLFKMRTYFKKQPALQQPAGQRLDNEQLLLFAQVSAFDRPLVAIGNMIIITGFLQADFFREKVKDFSVDRELSSGTDVQKLYSEYIDFHMCAISGYKRKTDALKHPRDPTVSSKDTPKITEQDWKIQP